MSSRPVAAPRRRRAARARPDGCSANAVPKTASSAAAVQQRRPTGEIATAPSADQGRADGERRLVGGALVGERGVDQAALVRAGAGGDRAPADPGERADLRQGEPGQRRRRATRAASGACRWTSARASASPAAPARDWTSTTGRWPSRSAREPANGRADGVRDGERAGGETADGVAAGGGGDEQEGAELAHGQRQPAEEGGDDVRRAGELEQAAVGGEG